MKSRLRAVAGALAAVAHLPPGFCKLRPRIAYGARVVASAAVTEDSLYDPTNAALRA